MKTRTKVVIGILAAILIAVTVLFAVVSLEHSGKTYYTQLINAGTATGNQFGEDSIEYIYTEPAFDEDGNEIEITFYSNRERALRVNAYLSVIFNEKNGVISYAEVQREDIPDKALAGLDRNAG